MGPNLIVIDRVFHENSPAKHYYDLGKEYAGHDTVNHRYEEYVRYTKDPEYVITTNTVEGYYSIFKRGMKGVYQHCKEKHLHHRRPVTRHGRQPGGGAWEVLVWPSGLSRRPEWISALSGSFQ